ncbi:uncharacterized protein [Diadema antillarum]|uniref:uncharacterized protein n=1 Tax=Diadema antillarum TaxID=105358 RepID=UPI003A857FE3
MRNFKLIIVSLCVLGLGIHQTDCCKRAECVVPPTVVLGTQGAVVGSAFGLIGTVVGGLIGGTVGGILGSFACKEPPQVDTSPPTFESPYEECNEEKPASNLGKRTVLEPISTHFWSEPSATDTESNPVSVELLIPLPEKFGEGLHAVSYIAQDSAPVPNRAICVLVFEVEILKCPARPHPPNGYHDCSSTYDATVDTVCHYSCRQGFILEGLRDQVCAEFGTSNTVDWVSNPPTCQEISCPSLAAPLNGHLTCTNSNGYNSICSTLCNDGYSLPPTASRDRVCLANGWTGDSVPKCADTTGPSFNNCPGSEPPIYAPPGQTRAVVDWIVPSATDNSVATVDVNRVKGPPPGTELDPGIYTIRYRAKDGEENVAECAFTRIVQLIQCSPLPIRPGLETYCSASTYRGSQCTFSCSTGFRLEGHNSTTCEKRNIRGEWTHQPPQCLELHCTDIAPPENGFFCQGVRCPTVHGALCCLECLPGYRIANDVSGVLQCAAQIGSEQANWIGEQPICEVQTCAVPYLDGGLIVSNPNSSCAMSSVVPAGKSCELTCREGYVLTGQATIECGQDGSWLQPTPRCEAIECEADALPTPANGGKSGCFSRKERYGTTCTLYCNVGYSPSVPVARTCIANEHNIGVWNGGTISCSVVRCDPLQHPSNGFIASCSKSGNNYSVIGYQEFNSVCQSRCDEGYTALYSQSRRCRQDGTWDGVDQRCVDDTDPDLQCPSDQVLFASEGQVTAFVQYDQWEPIIALDAGRQIRSHLHAVDSKEVSDRPPTNLTEGDHTLVYKAEDLSGNFQTCSFNVEVKVTRCLPLHAPANGDVILDEGHGSCQNGAVYGSRCSISCDEGYELSPAVDDEAYTMTCNRTGLRSTVGMWNEPTPTCNIVTCRLPNLPNGVVSGCPSMASSYGDVCQFSCIEGFSSADGRTSSTRRCQADGTLSGQNMTCDVPITCPPLERLRHGSVTPGECTQAASVPYDTTCSLLCDMGFQRVGPFQKTCASSGKWSDSRAVTCQDIQAPVFDIPCPSFSSYQADRGYTSVRMDIPTPTATDNSGNVTVQLLPGVSPRNEYPEGATSVTYTATDPEGNSAICDIYVSVTVFRCPPLQAPSHGSLIDCTSRIFGSVCSFQCNEGYELTGPSNRSCELHGGQAPASWDGTQPKCQAKTCPALTLPPDVIKSGCPRSPPYSEVFGTRCYFYCPYGFEGVGESSAICQADGTWSSNNFSCRATACPALNPAAESGVTVGQCSTNPSFGDVCMISCDVRGFRVTPLSSSILTCQGNGLWFPTDISAVTCQDVEEPKFTPCPADFVTYAPRRSTEVNVSWNVSAVDNGPTSPSLSCDRQEGVFVEGDYEINCRAKDEADNEATCSFDVDVRVRRCRQYDLPARSFFNGTCSTAWGSSCHVACSRGYQLIGSSVITCEFDGTMMYWDVEEAPLCQDVRCPPLHLPEDVQVNPLTCLDPTGVRQGTQCALYCHVGLTLIDDEAVLMCREDGRWTRTLDALSAARCEDKTKPQVTYCPLTLIADRTEAWGVEVTFREPTAIDTGGQPLQVITRPHGLTSPYNFTEDTHCSYTFVDQAGNNATCEFNVAVKDELSPILLSCPSNMSLMSDTQTTCVTWEQPVFHEITGDDLDITCNYDNGEGCFHFGNHQITCSATNLDNGKTAVCSFRIEIEPHPCPSLDAPANGAIACDGWLGGVFCNTFCNDRYDVPYVRGLTATTQYVCTHSGVWQPHSTVLDCTESRNVRRLQLPLEFYFEGSCIDYDTSKLIQEAFLQNVRSSLLAKDVCSAEHDCLVENVRVRCGININRRRRSVSPDIRELYERSKRRRYHVTNVNGRHRRRAAQQILVEFEISTNFIAVANETNYHSSLQTEENLLDVIEEMIDEDVFELDLGTDEENIGFSSFDHTFIQGECDAGYWANNNDYNCVPCSPGTYYSNETRNCLQCEKGSYQDAEAQTSCRQCPEGQSTEGQGAKNISACKDVCHPGHSSESGVAPCFPCGIGSYQPSVLGTDCISCPIGTTTTHVGSTYVDQCQVVCDAGTFSMRGFAPCSPCPVGSYQHLPQQSRCFPCPGNTTTRHEGTSLASLCSDVDLCETLPCLNHATCVNTGRSYSCLCMAGYTGFNCQKEIDECESNPCANGATCRDSLNDFDCLCAEGYSGLRCEYDIDECLTVEPCWYNATCLNLDGDYQCRCQDGFTGKDCDVEITPCQPDPCQNGATCSLTQLTPSGFECHCIQGYRGTNCSVDINECKSSPCQNGASCLDLIGSFSCVCTPGFTGFLCDIDADLCANVTCFNGGTCSELGGTAVCLCTMDFTGDFCEETRVACEDEPCVNGGVCVDMDSAYTCVCPDGFVGQNCDIPEDNCQYQPCSNDGTCINNGTSYTCSCKLGFNGPNCENELDDCTDNPCGPNGVCISKPHGFTCTCSVGWTGEWCTEELNLCSTQTQCSNGGTCTGDQSSFECHCPPGYQGARCENEINECLSKPCQNGGTCGDLTDSYQCHCPEGYNGTNCQNDIDWCADSPCTHGDCTDGLLTFTCSCEAGYTGRLCNVQIDFCSENRCENGLCLNLATTYRCDCYPGSTGKYCHRDHDECRSNPCLSQNTVECLNGNNEYTCVCKPGFTGIHCESDVNECSNDFPPPCVDTAECVNGWGSYHCKCLPGYEGDLCYIDTDDCNDDPCDNGGTCIDKVNGFSCRCPEGFSGTRCQLYTTHCDVNPCQNGGLCVLDESNGFTCNCLPGFTGPYCQTDIDDCAAHKCAAGSVCEDQINGYRCRCPLGLSGEFCEEETDECVSDPCQNGATCQDRVLSFSCQCPPGFKGTYCELDVQECASNPCVNHGTCIEGVDGFSCHCLPGYRGLLCEEQIAACLPNPCLNNATCVDGFRQFTCMCLPGYTGDRCEREIPSNYDLLMDNSRPSINHMTTHSLGATNFTSAFWIHVNLSKYRVMQIFSMRALNLTFRLNDNCEMTASESMYIDEGEPSALCDNRWHSILLQYDGSGEWALYIDRLLAISSTGLGTTGYDFNEPLAFTIGAESLNINETIQISGFNIWSGLVDDSLLARIQAKCHPGVFGNVLSWTDLATDEAYQDVFYAPSQCDDIDDCLSSPCLNGGTCLDKLHAYQCICPRGFNGSLCETHADLCDDHSCQNGGTCSSVNGTVVCSCFEDYVGTFCEIPIVHGGWGNWSTWGVCSASCAGGTRQRSRECINPPPNEFGRSCSGSNISIEECNTNECPGCPPLIAPVNGSVHCIKNNNTHNCTIRCDDSEHDFVQPVKPFYTCGPATNFAWSHQSLFNRLGTLPACRKIESPNSLEASVVFTYPDTSCTSDAARDELQQTFTSTLRNVSHLLSCDLNLDCDIEDIEISNCANRRKRAVVDEPVRISVVAKKNFSSTSGESGAQTYDKMRSSLLTLMANGSLTLTINGRQHALDPDAVTGQVKLVCPEGFGETATGGCSLCPIGTFQYVLNETRSYCVPCLPNSYQDEEGRTECSPCPDGMITIDFSSTKSSDCIMACPEGMYHDIKNPTVEDAAPCRPCPRNTYQNETGQARCTGCPEGYVTLQSGSEDVTDCVVACSQGMYLHPTDSPRPSCQACPLHTYQDRLLHQEEECIACPPGHITLTEGSQNSTDCQNRRGTSHDSNLFLVFVVAVLAIIAFIILVSFVVVFMRKEARKGSYDLTARKGKARKLTSDLRLLFPDNKTDKTRSGRDVSSSTPRSGNVKKMKKTSDIELRMFNDKIETSIPDGLTSTGYVEDESMSQ